MLFLRTDQGVEIRHFFSDSHHSDPSRISQSFTGSYEAARILANSILIGGCHGNSMT